MTKDIIAAVPDSLAVRRLESERVDRELSLFRSYMPSDYLSEVTGPFYTQLQRLIAEEYARIRSVGDFVFDDARFNSTRIELLYQNLGHLLHDVDERTSFIPEVKFDEDYRKFVLSILRAVLRGSGPDSLRQAITAATGQSGKIVELFRYLEPYSTANPAFDISDRNYWRFEVTPALGVDYNQLYRALLFVGRLMKPAHTNFDVQIRFPEIRRVGLLDGCCTFMGQLGKISAAVITKTRPLQLNEQYDDCVLHGHRLRGLVTSTLIGSTFTVEGITVEVQNFTVFQDIDGLLSNPSELQVGDLVEVDGLVVDTPLTLDGFLPFEKKSDQAVCKSFKWRFEQYAYRNTRQCRSEQVENIQVISEEIDWMEWPTRWEFLTDHTPLCTVDGVIAYQTVDNGISLVSVQHDDGINITDLDVLFADPYTGRVALAEEVPAGGTTTVTYRYLSHQPLIGAQFDTDGITFDQNEECIPFIAVSDYPAFDFEEVFSVAVGPGPNYFSAFILNDDSLESLLNNGLSLQGNDPLETRLTYIFSQTPLELKPDIYKVHYEGYHVADSTLFDTYSEFDDTESIRNKFDDFNLIVSRELDIFASGWDPRQLFDSLVDEQVHRIGTILVPWTQDFCNGVNRVFDREIFVPELSDLLRSIDSFLNQQNLLLNRAERARVYEYVQDLYTCVLAYTEVRQWGEDGSCWSKPRAHVCKTIRFEFV